MTGTKKAAGLLMAIDVGNTHTVIGLFDGREIVRHWRVLTEPERTADEYGMLMWNLYHASEMPAPKIEAIAVSCVVPPMTGVVQELCRNYFKLEPLVVGPGIKTGMPILYDNPKEIGADRIVNSVAAYERSKGASIVVDFGTATTFDFVSAKGEYVGGIIVPGVTISLDALYTRTAKLPRVEINRPPRVVGRNTVNAIQAGALFGYVGMVDSLVGRISEEESVEPYVVATGGLATLMAEESKTIREVDEFLTLDGLRIVYERN